MELPIKDIPRKGQPLYTKDTFYNSKSVLPYGISEKKGTNWMVPNRPLF